MKARLFTVIAPLLVAGLLLAGLDGGTASAAFPGRNGKIVFEGALTSDTPLGLWVGNSDGTGTAGVEIDATLDGGADAAWSSDGAEIAFSLRGNQQGIWVMNADGSGKRRLTNGPDEAPTWSPDGARIAFQRGRLFHMGLARSEIYVMNSDGSGQTDITNNPGDDSSPAWSPDGSKIAFDGLGGISVMNPDGSDQRNLPHFDYSCGGWGPEWSPDGSKIAYVRSCDTVHCDGSCSEIAVMNADGSKDTDLTGFAFDSDPAWSPDGTKIAFAHCDYDPDHIYCPKYRTHVWVMNPDGSDKRNVTSRFYYAEGVDWQPLPLANPANSAVRQPTRPPLRSRVAYAAGSTPAQP